MVINHNMSISIDEPLMGEDPKNAEEPFIWQETILTNAFDEQIKLVEKSVNAAKNEGAKEKKNKNAKKTDNNTTKGHNSNSPTQNFQKSYDKNVYTNRSRIYRYNEDEIEDTIIPDTIPLPQKLHPPTDLGIDSTKDVDNKAQARASMLTSWYMAGYHTGYYDAMKKYKKDLN